jgi:beta propeller repeat protein
MKNFRNGFSNIVILVFLGGLVIAMIAIFNSLGGQSSGPSSSPVPTAVGSQASPLSTPTASSIPLARIGEPTLMRPNGQQKQIEGGLDPRLGIIKKNNEEYLAAFDLTTGQERKLLDKNPWWPRYSGHWLAYVDQQPLGAARYSYQIKVRDLNTSKEISLAKGNAIQKYPDISNNIVVWMNWQDEDPLGPDVYAYDLTAKKDLPVVGGPGSRSYPKVSGKWVIYLQWTGKLPDDGSAGIAELRAHSLETGEDFAIGPTRRVNDSFFGTYHAIDGDKIAWTKYNAGNNTGELHLYDLITRNDRRLTEPHNFPPAHISISAQSGLITYIDDGWTVLDYLQPAPVSAPLPQPPESLGSYDSLALFGNYLIGQASIKRSVLEERTFAPFVMKITR